MRTSSVVVLVSILAGCAAREHRLDASRPAATSSLESAMATARQRAPEAEARRIWAGKDADASGAPSPDGTLLAYTDWATSSLGVRDLRTGEHRILVRNVDGDWRDGWPEGSAFSDDGKRIAFQWFDAKGADLRVVDVAPADAPTDARAGAAAEPRVVVPKSADITRIWPLEWTADGREVLVGAVRSDHTRQLAFVDVATGALRPIRTTHWGDAGGGTAALSRDGRYLAVSVPSPTSPDKASDVVVFTRDGTREVARLARGGVERVIGWAADGRLFVQWARTVSGEGSTPSLLAVRTRDGQPVGEPELVMADMSRVLYPHVTRDGRLFYGLLSGSYDVYVAGVDVANARVLAPAARVTHRLVGFNQGIDWTADGRRAAYLVREGAAPVSPSVLAIRDQESGDVRELRPDLEYINAAIRWSPDGRAIVAQATDPNGRVGLYTIDAQSGRVTPIVYADPKGGMFHRPQWTPDGRAIYYLVFDTDHPQIRIVRRDLAGGAERDVFGAEKLGVPFSLSDDGTMLAVVRGVDGGSVISVLPAAGGPLRDVVRLPASEWVSATAWSRDGKYVLFAKMNRTASSGELWRVPLGGGSAAPVGIAMENLMGLRMHPDGQRVGFTGGVADLEVWAMSTGASGAARSRPDGASR